jgi:hypothetical protein
MTLAVLAGMGLYYAARPGDDGAEKARAVYLTLGGLVGLVLVLLLLKDAFFDFEKPGEAQLLAQQVAMQNNVAPNDPRVADVVRNFISETSIERADRFTADALRTLFFLVLAGLVFVAYRRGMVPAWAMQAALALLVVFDLWGVDRRYLNEDSLVEADTPADEIQAYGFDRYLTEQADDAGGPGHFRVLSLEGDVDKNARPSYFYESISGYHGAKLRLYQDYIEHLLYAPGERLPNANALALMNTRYVVSPVPVPGMEVAYRDEQTRLSVYRNEAALPRAFFVGETDVVASSEEAWQRLRSPDFDPHRTALLPEPIDFTTTPIDSAATVEVELLSYSPREIEWRVQTDAPRLLVVSEVYYPAGWTASLDDAEVPIYRADYLLRAVPVTAGEHTLRMAFNPRSHTLGVWVSALSTLVVFGGVVVLRGLAYRRRTAHAGGGMGAG